MGHRQLNPQPHARSAGFGSLQQKHGITTSYWPSRARGTVQDVPDHTPGRRPGIKQHTNPRGCPTGGRDIHLSQRNSVLLAEPRNVPQLNAVYQEGTNASSRGPPWITRIGDHAYRPYAGQSHKVELTEGQSRMRRIKHKSTTSVELQSLANESTKLQAASAARQ